MNQWETWLGLGNEEYARSNYEAAHEAYHQSLYTVLRRFGHFVDKQPKAAISAVMISYLNIADTLIALKRFDEASYQYESAYCFVCRLINGPGLETVRWNASLEGLLQLCKSWRVYAQSYSACLTSEHKEQFNTAQDTLCKLSQTDFVRALH